MLVFQYLAMLCLTFQIKAVVLINGFHGYTDAAQLVHKGLPMPSASYVFRCLFSVSLSDFFK